MSSSNPSTSASSLSATDGASSSSPPLRVLCYGDSLTAGTSPPGFEEFPYAPYLQAQLEAHEDPRVASTTARAMGFPGWTATQMVETLNSHTGLATCLRASPPPSVVVLLAGTNDLGYCAGIDPNKARPVILDPILSLHKTCHDLGIPTVAIGIPSSAYQAMVPDAQALANAVNKGLEEFCQTEDKATYVPFPFGFARGDKKWSPDGLHFSKEGYETLGIHLAPTVAQALLK